MNDEIDDKIRIPLTLTPEEIDILDKGVKTARTVTRMRFLRQALKFYAALVQCKAEGYSIQAIRQGSLLQFPDLATPFPMDTSGPLTIAPSPVIPTHKVKKNPKKKRK